MAFWQGARWETDLRWVVLNFVGGANACLRTFQRMWQTMKTKSVPQPQPTESHFEQSQLYDVQKSVWACTENMKSSQGARLAFTNDKRGA